MKRMHILIGLVRHEVAGCGGTAFGHQFIRALRQKVDVSVITITQWLSGEIANLENEGPSVEETTWEGLSSLIIRPRTSLAYNLTGTTTSAEVAESCLISEQIADFARRQKIDLFHILHWEYLKSCLFEAALQAKKPFVFTPYDYLTFCPRVFMRQRNKIFCSGPDKYARKCLLCLESIDGFWGVISRFMKRYNRRMSFMAFSGLGSLLGPGYEPQWSIVVRHRAIRKYLLSCARILPFSTLMAKEMQRHLKLPSTQFTVCKYGLLTDPHKLPKGKRFRAPLHIGYIQRISYESGAFFILEAWRRANIRPDQAILHMFAQPGGKKYVEDSVYKKLVDKGYVQIKEGIIAEKMDEILIDISAVVVGYQMKYIGSSAAAYEAVARGIPAIAPEWKSNANDSEDGLIEGINAIKYCNFDVNSLSKTLKKCCRNPNLLERLYETCDLPAEFRKDAYIQKILKVCEDIINKVDRKQDAQG